MKKVFLILGLCLSQLWSTAQQTLPVQQRIMEAMSDYDYETALTLINQEAFPSPQLLYQKGRALRALGNNTEALKVFEELVQKDTLNPRAYIEAAECNRLLARIPQAIEYYRQAIRQNPANKYAHLQFISLLLAQRRYREALQESTRLAEQDSSAYVLHLRAEAMEHTCDNIDTIVGAYQDIRCRYPSDYLAAAKLGNIYIAGQMYPEAIAVTEEFRKTDSTNIIVNRVNAQAYSLNKDYPQAIARYDQLLQAQDSSFMTCFYAGVSHYAVEHFYEAHDLLLHALKQDESNVNVLYYLGRACSKSSWKEEGVDYLKRAIELTVPADSVVSKLYVGLIDCYKMARRYKEQAAAIMKRYREYEPTKHKLLYDAAFVYFYQLKDTARTKQCLEAYLRTRPKQSTQLFTPDGIPIIDESNRYNAAERWLRDIEKQENREKFFRGDSNK